jgi:hypothetical protein
MENSPKVPQRTFSLRTIHVRLLANDQPWDSIARDKTEPNRVLSEDEQDGKFVVVAALAANAAGPPAVAHADLLANQIARQLRQSSHLMLSKAVSDRYVGMSLSLLK